MKKIVSKLRKKQPEEPAGRITTDTLAEHREKVLAGGRKFKYPVQYQRHKLVINALVIGAVAVVLLVALGWYLLYVTKNTSEFMYRVTKVVPAPVAIVDGEQVPYSDYLMKYRGAAHYLIEKEQIDAKSSDGKSQLDYVKGQALDDAIADAYARKLASSLDVSVSNADVEAALMAQRQLSDGDYTEATQTTVLMDYYGWTIDEYREIMHDKLLRQKVAYAVDAPAEDIAKKIEDQVKAGNTDLRGISDSLNATAKDTVTYNPPEWVPKNNQDGGLAIAAAKLSKGQISTKIKRTSGDGYYYVKLVDSNDANVQYEYIHVPLKEFDAKLAKIEKDNKLIRFIKLEEQDQTTGQSTDPAASQSN